MNTERMNCVGRWLQYSHIDLITHRGVEVYLLLARMTFIFQVFGLSWNVLLVYFRYGKEINLGYKLRSWDRIVNGLLLSH